MTPVASRATPAALRVREIVSPEGVPLPFRVASAGERAAAFLIDGVIIGACGTALVLLVILLAIALEIGGDSPFATLAVALGLLGWFAVANLYFLFFELRWGGSTPGKRRLGLRVIARDGGPLTGEAVLARNLTRQIEIFVPLGAFVAPQGVAFEAPTWVAYATGLWLLLLPLVPLFNRDRLRCGDLVGGTIVVRQPRVVLLEDVAAAPAAAGATAGAAAGAAGGAGYAFNDAQLATYGIYELQVLEDVLRQAEDTPELAVTVAGRIAKRIGWGAPPPPHEARAFLQAFYRAQRERLEGRLLLGDRKERKS